MQIINGDSCDSDSIADGDLSAPKTAKFEPKTGVSLLRDFLLLLQLLNASREFSVAEFNKNRL